MNFSKIFRTAAVAAAAVFAFGTAQAQSPDQQLGIGVTTGTALGGTISYAITPAFHVGTIIGFSAVDNSNTVVFAPYGRFLFAGPATFKPFIQGQFGYIKTANSDGTSTIGIGGGGEYFVNRNLGIYGGLTVVSIGLSDQGNAFGLLQPQMGIEWFF